MSHSNPLSTPNKNEFAQVLRKRVQDYFKQNELSEYGNTNLLLKSLFMIAIYLGPFILMLTGVFESLFMVLLSWAIMGLGMSGIGMAIMHDANHKSYSKHNWVNTVLSTSLYLLGGFPPNWRQQHNVNHHKYTNVEGMDEDINPVGILRFSPHKPLKKIHRYQHIYAWFFYGLMTISWITNKDFKQLINYKKDKVKIDRSRKYGELFTTLIISKVLYFAISLALPLLIMDTAWYFIVLGFLLMHFVSGSMMGIIFQTAHVMPENEYPLLNDDGKIDNNWFVHQLQTTCNYSPKNAVFSWLIGGLNHQIEHHLFPAISHVHYRKLAVVVQSTAREYGIPYNVQPNFFKAIKYHFHMLKSLGR